MHKSEGQAGVLRPLDAQDYYDLIEWVALQPWCTGRVGLMGASYLAMSKWHVAALKPPHLRAIVPWEGVTDLYREFAFHGGIPETRFVPTWFKIRIKCGRNRRFSLAEDFLVETERHPLDDVYWSSKRPIRSKDSNGYPREKNGCSRTAGRNGKPSTAMKHSPFRSVFSIISRAA
jgi:putative CocE/NonD family hydrolase